MLENFVYFIPLKGEKKDAATICDAMIKQLRSDGLDMLKCVSQSYDNAPVMAGDKTGVQTRFREVASAALYT